MTIEDYEALPEERRAELIDGRLYDLTAPTGIHQQIVMRIWKALDKCIENTLGKFKVRGTKNEARK